MKLIILGDIHANLPALEKCISEAKKEGYDRILHAGDLVGYGPFPNETIQLLRAERIEGVRGNWDESVAWGSDSPGGIHPDARLAEAARTSYPWTQASVNAITRNILGNLPFEIRLKGGGMTFLLVHANPVDNTTYVPEDADDLTFQEHAKAAGVDGIVFGHTHQHYHRQVTGCHFVNVGSVGVATEKDRRTGYTVIYTGNIGKGIDVNFRRFDYDHDRVTRRYQERGIANPLNPPLSRSA